MRITDFALRNRTTTLVMSFLIIVIGMVSYLLLPLEATPDIKIPTIMVVVPYPGVSPEDTESLITEKLEAEFEDLRDVDELKSVSSEGMSLVYVWFLPGTDVADASQRVRDRVNRARPSMPKDIQEPVIQEITSSDWPVLIVNISGESNDEATLVRLKRIAEDLKQEVEAIPGVLEADVTGGLEREIRVEVDPHLLHSYGLALQDVINALAAENINIPGGPVEEGDIRYTLRIAQEISDPREIENMVVSTKFDHPVRVREVGRVVDGFKERLTISRYKQREGVSLAIKKQSGSNVVDMVTAVKKTIEERAPSFPMGTKVAYLNDQSKRILDMVHELENNIITALLLVVGVLFLFIGGRNAVFVAIAIPMSMLLTFIALSALGVTLNMVVFFGLILGLGMLVDNAIVVVENIYRHTRDGKGLLAAAAEGTREVAWPVTTSTLTTLAVFIPLLPWPGIMGEFIHYLPLTIVISLTCSLFVALVINPVIAAVFMVPDPRTGSIEEGKGLKAAFMRGYRRMLVWSVDHALVVLLSMLGLLVLAGVAVALFKPTVEFFPTTSPEASRVTVRCAEGTALPATDRVTRPIEDFLETLPNVKSYQTDVGVGGEQVFRSGGSEGTPYLATLSLDYQDRPEWTESPFQTIESIRTAIQEIAGAEIRVEKERRGPPTGSPVNIEIAGEDFEVLSEVSGRVEEKIRDIPGIADIRDDFQQGRPELRLHFDRVLSNKLVLQGLSIVAGTVRTAIYGTKATSYRIGDEEFDVTVRLQDRFRKNREDILSLVVAGKEGRQIPLSEVVNLRGDVGATSIRHVDRKRVVTVKAEAEGRPGPEVLKDVRTRLADYRPRGVGFAFTGENKEMDKAKVFLAKSLVIGLFLIAMILLAEFNSIGQVMVIMFSVILSMIGVIIGLLVNRMSFSIMMTGVGVISLAGVVVNNAIVLIDFVNEQVKKGHTMREAVVEAGIVRLRPVLLTAGTTVLGLVPMAQGIDFDFRNLHIETGTGSTEFWGPMAIAVIYGLTFATVLTLVFVPAFCVLLDDAKKRASDFLGRHALLRKALVSMALLAVLLAAYGLITAIAGMGTAYGQGVAPAAPARVLTLKEALKQARTFSPELKAAGERITQAKAQVRQALSLLLPFATAQGSYARADQEVKLDFGSMTDFYRLALANCATWDEAAMGPIPSICAEAAAGGTQSSSSGPKVIQELNNWEASINVGLNLFNARTIPLIKNVRTARDLAALQASFTQETLLHAVVQMYFGISTAQAAARLMEENVETTLQHQELTRVRDKNGVALANELIRADMAVVQARASADRAGQLLALSKRSLATVIGLREVDFRVEETPPNPWADLEAPADDDFATRLDGRKDLLMLDRTLLMARRGVTDVGMKWLPTFAGVWSYSLKSNPGFAADHDSWRAMISMSWSLFEGGRRLFELSEAKARVREAALRREAAEVRAKGEAEQAASGIETARTELASAEQMVELAGRNLTLVETQYRLGAAQQTVLLDAQYQHKSAQIQVLQSRLRLSLARIALARALGLFEASAF